MARKPWAGTENVMRYLVALVALAAVSCGRIDSAGPVAGGSEISYRCFDGWTIRGDYYPARNAKAAVVLLHQRGGSAADWKPVIPQMVTAGISVLAIDQRGAGRSTGPHNGNDAPWDTTIDIAGAAAWLKAKGFAYDHIGLAGASYGANNAMLYTAAASGIPAVALLSPGADYNGLKPPPALGKHNGAILVLAAKNDSIMRGGIEAVRTAASKAEIKTYSGSAHGTQLFAANPESKDDLVSFLKAHL